MSPDCCSLADKDQPHYCTEASSNAGTCQYIPLTHDIGRDTQLRLATASDDSNTSLVQIFRTIDEVWRTTSSEAKQASPLTTSASADLSTLPHAQPDTPRQRQQSETQSVYIFSPRHDPMAFFLFKSKDGEVGNSYQAEHVFVKLLPEFGTSGKPVYQMEVASNDMMGQTIRCDFAAEGTKTKGCQIFEATTRRSAPSSFSATAQGVSKAETRAERPCGSTAGTGLHHTAGILMRTAQHHLRLLAARADGSDDSHVLLRQPGNKLCGICDGDLTAAFDLAIAELEKTDRVEVAAMHSTTDMAHSVFNSPPVLRPTVDGHINPHPVVAAEPATTICTPKPTFSIAPLEAQGIVKRQKMDLSVQTTVVPGWTIAEVLWTEDERDGRKSPSSGSSGVKYGMKSRDYMAFDISDSGSSSQNSYAEDVVADGEAVATRCSLSTDRRSTMTSFPELRSRHCTREWTRPPVEMEQLNRAPSMDFYQLGVDAHSGGTSPIPKDCVGEDLAKTLDFDHSLFTHDPFSYANIHAPGRRVTDSLAYARSDRRLGSRIGSASHQRRSSLFVGSKPADAPLDLHEGSMPAVLDRLRSLRKSYLHDRRHVSGGTCESEMAAPANTPANDHSGSRSRDSLIRELTPELPKADPAGIYEAMTGSRVIRPSDICGTCSEDHRPHLCENHVEMRSG
ncbi:hypothetical protein RJ55_00695 [Drechmeria coniospora]|nr:hypothetical protein RJ55_00695 [Drechmeria coniospora]